MACIRANLQRAATSLAAALSRSCPKERLNVGATRAAAKDRMNRTTMSSRSVNPAARNGPGLRVLGFGFQVGATRRVAPTPEMPYSKLLLIVLLNPLPRSLDTLPAHDVLVLSLSTGHPISTVRDDIVVPVLSRRLVEIGMPPWIERDLLLFQIGAIPVLDRSRIDKQCPQALVAGRIASDVEPKVVQGSAE